MTATITTGTNLNNIWAADLSATVVASDGGEYRIATTSTNPRTARVLAAIGDDPSGFTWEELATSGWRVA